MYYFHKLNLEVESERQRERDDKKDRAKVCERDSI